MKSTKSRPVLIVGGGIGGAVTAIALARKGIPSIVLEQNHEFRELGAGFQLCPNVFKMFDYLGIIKPIFDIAFIPENLIYNDGESGENFARIPLGQEMIKRFNYPHGLFHRGELLSTLIKECKKLPLIKLVTSARIVEVKELEDRVVAITADKNSFEGEVLIGCDGLWSIIRDHVLGKVEPRVTKSMSYRALVPIEQIPEHLRSKDIVHWHSSNFHFLHYPNSAKGLFNILAELKSDVPHQALDTKGNPEEFDRSYSNAVPEVLELLKFVDKSRMWMMIDRDPISNWTKGRITLLGDSAHPTLPHMASGAGMAIEDAVVLAEYLGNEEMDYASAFKAYQEERYLRTAYVQIMSRSYSDVHYASGVARDLRNHLFSQSNKLELIYELLGIIYQGIEIPQIGVKAKKRVA